MKQILTRKELAILRLAHAYGFSDLGTEKLILGLRERKKNTGATPSISK